jgi:hypothetical protein
MAARNELNDLLMVHRQTQLADHLQPAESTLRSLAIQCRDLANGEILNNKTRRREGWSEESSPQRLDRYVGENDAMV